MTSESAVCEVHTIAAGTGCGICGSALADDSEICPGCGSRGRTRAIPTVLDRLDLGSAGLPLLVFGGTELEARALIARFPGLRLKSVSLYRYYLPGHEMGVDARDLSRYPAGAFAGHFSSLLFDYFPEHQQALAEAYRVIVPGGVFVTHIAPYRLLEDDSPPEVLGSALEEEFPDTHVGARWFIDAISAAGFEAQWIQVREQAGVGRRADWFIGRKPRSAPWPEGAEATRKSPPVHTGQFSGGSPTKTLGCRLRPEFGYGHVEITWTLPPLPEGVRFGSHVPLPSRSGRVVALGGSSLFFSDDVGESWDSVDLEVSSPLPLDTTFVLADGGVLAQTRGRRVPDDPATDDDAYARIYVFDAGLNLRGDVRLGVSQWHGAGGIDEHAGTLIWAEYPANTSGAASDSDDVQPGLSLDSHVHRSTDGGLTWNNVLTVTSAEIRHFHVVRADRHEPGVWWASTGDRREECRTFRSGDDGRSWHEVTGEPSSFPNNARARSWHVAHRYTDLVVTDEHLIWGTDDDLGSPGHIDDPTITLGQRVGSRLCVALKDKERICPEVRGWIGNPVRSILDVGPAWLLVTEAKRLSHPRPQLVLVGKQPPFAMQEIGTVDLFQGLGPFTRSCTSRVAVDGRFFSFRQSGAVFPTGPRVLQWDVRFR